MKETCNADAIEVVGKYEMEINLDRVPEIVFDPMKSCWKPIEIIAERAILPVIPSIIVRMCHITLYAGTAYKVDIDARQVLLTLLDAKHYLITIFPKGCVEKEVRPVEFPIPSTCFVDKDAVVRVEKFKVDHQLEVLTDKLPHFSYENRQFAPMVLRFEKASYRSSMSTTFLSVFVKTPNFSATIFGIERTEEIEGDTVVDLRIFFKHLAL